MLTEWLVIRADGWLDLHENTGKHRQTLDTKLVSGWMSDVSLVGARMLVGCWLAKVVVGARVEVRAIVVVCKLEW